jgi:hypothetical protein
MSEQKPPRLSDKRIAELESNCSFRSDCDSRDISIALAELQDWRNTQRAVMQETCTLPADMRHCTCVPMLRKRIADLESEWSKPEPVSILEDAIGPTESVFQECPTCRAIPVPHLLCIACLHNRSLIGRLTRENERLETRADFLVDEVTRLVSARLDRMSNVAERAAAVAREDMKRQCVEKVRSAFRAWQLS